MRAFVQRFEDHTHRSPMHDSSSDSAKGSPFEEAPRIVAQRQAMNHAGNEGASSGGGSTLPHALTRGIAALSGMDVSDVMVHRNSSRPAAVNALATAQNNEIHLAPGQEKHLPHEAWHIVQQRQGRVSANMQEKGVDMNDEPGLEKEATVMGERALRTTGPVSESVVKNPSMQAPAQGAKTVMQRQGYGDLVVANKSTKKDVYKRCTEAKTTAHGLRKSDKAHENVWKQAESLIDHIRAFFKKAGSSFSGTSKSLTSHLDELQIKCNELRTSQRTWSANLKAAGIELDPYGSHDEPAAQVMNAIHGLIVEAANYVLAGYKTASAYKRGRHSLNMGEYQEKYAEVERYNRSKGWAHESKDYPTMPQSGKWAQFDEAALNWAYWWKTGKSRLYAQVGY